MLAPLAEAAEHALLGRFFRRDNSARLTRYFLVSTEPLPAAVQGCFEWR